MEHHPSIQSYPENNFALHLYTIKLKFCCLAETTLTRSTLALHADIDVFGNGMIPGSENRDQLLSFEEEEGVCRTKRIGTISCILSKTLERYYGI